MPFDPTGKYSLPPSYFAVAGQTIRTEQHNPPFEDIQQALSNTLLRDGRGGLTAPLNAGGFAVKNMAAGTDATDAATVGQASAPIGSIMDYAGDTAPAGWFLCFGQAISRTDYPALFSILGAKFGAGNGTTTFNLPDCRGRVTAGLDNMGGTDASRLSALVGSPARTLGGSFGVASHVLTASQMPTHAHSGTTDAATVSSGLRSGASSTAITTGSINPRFRVVDTTGTDPFIDGVVTGGAHAHSFTTSQMGNNEAHPNVQPTIMFNKIIKAAL